ncbi:hypothetical protein THAOC_04625 [Thalassiosira oceanica]|uniref:Uncharacterized protein n=1 Tax=Thalassiosira oceanica TaxID=159749 RepID=K0T4U9_THAOC|nr:hypothetical protein THAOC_04625 [Thalassiosira oceanica]|eukprot:EJK73738.1 hypothetical protein THAOC_04625 [Thalassiosira oceanica]
MDNAGSRFAFASKRPLRGSTTMRWIRRLNDISRMEYDDTHTKNAGQSQRLDRDDSRDPASYWDPGVSLALASSRRAERNTATSLDYVKPIGWARAGSAEGRRTGRGPRRMPGEGGRSVWLGGGCVSLDFGLEPRDFDLWGQRRTMPDNGDLAGGTGRCGSG